MNGFGASGTRVVNLVLMHADNLARLPERDESTPWGTGLTVAAFVAAVIGTAVVVLGLGVTRVNPAVAVVLNLVAVGGLAPTLLGWRRVPVRRWFALGAAVGVSVGWIVLAALAIRS